MANWSSRSTFERFYHRSECLSEFTRAVFQSGHSSRYDLCLKRTTSYIVLFLVSRNSRIQFTDSPEDKVHKGRMDCMKRSRIQGTLQSHVICVFYILPFYSSMQMASF